MTTITASQDIPESESKISKELTTAVDYLKSETKRMKDLTRKEEALLPPVQAAAMLGISPQAVEKRIREGSLRSYQVFGKTYLAGKQIEELMVERIKRLIAAGTDKNQLEKSIYKKWIVNAKVASKKVKAQRGKAK